MVRGGDQSCQGEVRGFILVAGHCHVRAIGEWGCGRERLLGGRYGGRASGALLGGWRGSILHSGAIGMRGEWGRVAFAELLFARARVGLVWIAMVGLFSLRERLLGGRDP